jgi:PTS system mannose-specific IIB component
LVLLRRVQTAQALVAAGLPIPHLNVGNLASKPGARRVVRAIALTAADVAALDDMAARGVRISFQPTPDDPALAWSDVRRRWRAP